MEKYLLLGIKEKKSKKTDNTYHIAYILLENEYGFDVLNVMIKEKQVKALSDVIGDEHFDIGKYLKPQYNTFNKRYDLVISYGL